MVKGGLNYDIMMSARCINKIIMNSVKVYPLAERINLAMCLYNSYPIELSVKLYTSPY